eukprot:COSAG05_NODE_49_length_24373_cov_16.162561_5_plen_50_part_00
MAIPSVTIAAGSPDLERRRGSDDGCQHHRKYVFSPSAFCYPELIALNSV